MKKYVSQYRNIHVHVHTYIYTYIHVHTRTYTLICTFIYVHIRVYTRIYHTTRKHKDHTTLIITLSQRYTTLIFRAVRWSFFNLCFCQNGSVQTQIFHFISWNFCVPTKVVSQQICVPTQIPHVLNMLKTWKVFVFTARKLFLPGTSG